MKFGLIYNTGYYGTDGGDGGRRRIRHPRPPGDVAAHAANGTTRLAVPPASADEAGQRDEISAFADRLGLR